jgi:IS5 family transposase
MTGSRSGASPASRSPRACRITADLALPGGVGLARPAERLLAEVNSQLDGKGLVLRRGTLIDATILEAAVRPPAGDAGEVSGRDPQAGWTKKNGKSRFGYKAHVAVDEDSGLVRKAVMTAADVHDSVMGDDLVQGDEQAVYAEKILCGRPLAA